MQSARVTAEPRALEEFGLRRVLAGPARRGALALGRRRTRPALGSYPAVFLVLAGTAALAAVLATDSTPGLRPRRP